jgi:hypothetical protein
MLSVVEIEILVMKYSIVNMKNDWYDRRMATIMWMIIFGWINTICLSA